MVRPVFTFGTSDDARALREEVFVAEQGFKNEFDEHESDCICLVLKLDGLPIATGRLVKIDPATYQVGRVAVKKEYRGQRIGSYLLAFLSEKAKELGANALVAHAQLDKQNFYRRNGFEDFGEGAVDFDEGVPHIYLRKQLVSKWRR